MTRRIVITVLCALAVGGCIRKDPPKGVIAVVGNRWIDTTELNRSYVLQPQWKRGQTRIQSYLTQASALITQKLYVQEAEARGLDRDSLMAGYLGFLKQKEMIKGLYRREVSGKVQIRDAEVRRMYGRMKKKVDFSYVYARDSARCAEYLGALKRAQLPVPADSSVRVGTKEGVTIGMVAPELEPAVFDAGLHDVRGPIRVGNGYIAVRITGGEHEKFLSETDLLPQRRKIENLIGDRKMDSLSSRYVAGLMRDTGLQLNAPVFWAVADYFGRRVQEAHVDAQQMQTVYVTSDELRALGDDLKMTGNAIVVTHRDGAMTVRELLDALSNMPGSLRPRVRTPQNLKDAIGSIVRNRFLLKEAERQGLAEDPEVLAEYAMQRDEALANAYYASRRAAVTVTPEEVEAFKKRSPVAEEQVFFTMNMGVLARDAKIDSVLRSEMPALKARYEIRCDTAKIRAMISFPDDVLRENPVRLFLRELFM